MGGRVRRGGVGGWEGAEGRGGGPPTRKKWLTVKKQSISNGTCYFSPYNVLFYITKHFKSSTTWIQAQPLLPNTTS